MGEGAIAFMTFVAFRRNPRTLSFVAGTAKPTHHERPGNGPLKPWFKSGRERTSRTQVRLTSR